MTAVGVPVVENYSESIWGPAGNQADYHTVAETYGNNGWVLGTDSLWCDQYLLPISPSLLHLPANWLGTDANGGDVLADPRLEFDHLIPH